jgi:hypothetical protein
VLGNCNTKSACGGQLQRRAEGKRVHEFSNKELMLMAEDYLAAHREELIPLARARAEEIFAKR